jgi:GT2 family glycosyltransferase
VVEDLCSRENSQSCSHPDEVGSVCDFNTEWHCHENRCTRLQRTQRATTISHAEQSRRESLLAAARPPISVVLVTYNRAALLERTLQDLLAQDLGDFELIIADDASTDSTRELCSTVVSDPRARYHRRQHNVGMPKNLNLGIEAARGEYIAILHDDDVYSPALLSKWKASLDVFPTAAFVFNACAALDSKGQVVRVFREDLPPCFPGSDLLESIYFKRWRFGSPVWGATMIRRTALHQVGLFDERFGFWSDVDMWLRLSEQYDVAYIDEPLISVTSGEAAPHLFDDRFRIFQPLLERMFWEARMRHTEGKPWRRIVEIGKHLSFSAAARTYHAACRAKRILLA